METEKEALSVKLNEEEEKRSKIELSLLAKESDWGEIMAEQTAEMERLKRELKARTQEVHMWQSWVENKDYAIMYFDYFAAFKSSGLPVRDGAHTRCMYSFFKIRSNYVRLECEPCPYWNFRHSY